MHMCGALTIWFIYFQYKMIVFLEGRNSFKRDNFS